MSMDSNGKILFAKHSEIQQANLKNIAGELHVNYVTVTNNLLTSSVLGVRSNSSGSKKRFLAF